MHNRYKEQGATALIVVVFSILLLMTVSLGFLRLVIQDQQRAQDDELSRGAYDSANAGVEDGKRVLQACSNGDLVACNAISAGECNTIHRSDVLHSHNTDTSEVFLQKIEGQDNKLDYDQAYTCVKINRQTNDVVGSIEADSSKVIPLNTNNNLNSITVSWFKKPSSGTVNIPTGGTTPLPQNSAWSPAGQVRPPVLRVQLMQYNKSSINLLDFDGDNGGRTLYLYPNQTGSTNLDFALDGRRSGSGSLLKPVLCQGSVMAGIYMCEATISVPNGATHGSYLRLTSIYGAADFRLTAQAAAGAPTQFLDVQPSIDSTGRASDVYRRVKARVEPQSNVDIFPRATVDVTNNFCKSFSVLPTPGSFNDGGCSYTGP